MKDIVNRLTIQSTPPHIRAKIIMIMALSMIDDTSTEELIAEKIDSQFGLKNSDYDEILSMEFSDEEIQALMDFKSWTKDYEQTPKGFFNKLQDVAAAQGCLTESVIFYKAYELCSKPHNQLWFFRWLGNRSKRLLFRRPMKA